MEPKEPDSRRSSLINLFANLLRVPVVLVELLLDWTRSGWRHPDLNHRRGFRALAGVVLAVAALAWWRDIYIPAVDRADLVQLLQASCWVTYDPPSRNPLLEIEATSSSIRDDLHRIHKAGFTGVVTFGSQGSLNLIPQLAKSERLAVIVGLWDPGNIGEVRRAIEQQRFADAYCVGHDGLDRRGGYTFEALKRTIQLVKRRTRRPVATTEEVRRYKDPRLLGLGDWYFPDIHVSLVTGSPYNGTQLDRAMPHDSSLELAKSISVIAAAAERPLMLKMITFPWRGAPRASLDSQAGSYARFLDSIRDPEQPFAARPSVVIHSAFDLHWKIRYPYYEWDLYTGVLAEDGRPRPAMREITQRCP